LSIIFVHLPEIDSFGVHTVMDFQRLVVSLAGFLLSPKYMAKDSTDHHSL